MARVGIVGEFINNTKTSFYKIVQIEVRNIM